MWEDYGEEETLRVLAGPAGTGLGQIEQESITSQEECGWWWELAMD